jgi:hypothetical protein
MGRPKIVNLTERKDYIENQYLNCGQTINSIALKLSLDLGQNVFTRSLKRQFRNWGFRK